MIFSTNKGKHLIAVFTVIIIAGSLSLARSDDSHKAAVVTNSIECSEYAMDIIRDGGSVADAAITALLCEGVANAPLTGLGGGFVMTIYTKSTGKVETLNAREMAPLLSFKDMFINTTVVTGVKSIAIPGELKGYWELHKKYGKLEWKRLFKPVIKLCRKGHVVSHYFGKVLLSYANDIHKSPSLTDIYINPETNEIYKFGDYIRRPQLAETLELIANEGASTLYENGTLAKILVKEIQAQGGIITHEDFLAYNVTWAEAIVQEVVGNRTLYSHPLPGSGSLVTLIINVLKDLINEGPTLKSFHRIVESFKFAYGIRAQFGDTDKGRKISNQVTHPQFANEIRSLIDDKQTYNDFKHYFMNASQPIDRGTAHLNVLAPNGDAISVTGSINSVFGSKIRSKKTGIILNDSMDDFAVPGRTNRFGLPPSPQNYIKPKKRPLSSMCPSILLNKNADVELLIGAAGGSKITSSVAYALLRYLYFKETTFEILSAPRFHHQLLPMEIVYEMGVSNHIHTGLEALGHKMVFYPRAEIGITCLTAIGRDGNKLVPVFDPRCAGSTSIL